MRFYRLFLLTVAYVAIGCSSPQVNRDQKSKRQDPVKLLGGGLLPGQSENHLKKEFILASELARTIEGFDGVVEARVHLNLVDQSPLSRDHKSSNRAAILVRHLESQPPGEEKIRKLASAAIHGLKPEDISVFFTPVPVIASKTVFVGPIEVVESSVITAKIWLLCLVLTCLLAALGLIVAGLKIRSLKSKRG